MLTYDCWVSCFLYLWPGIWWALLIAALPVLLHKHSSRISFPFTYLLLTVLCNARCCSKRGDLGRLFSTAKWMSKLFCENLSEANGMSRKLKLKKPSKVVGWSWKWSCSYSWVDDGNGSLSQTSWSLTRAEELLVHSLCAGQLLLFCRKQILTVWFPNDSLGVFYNEIPDS